MAASTADAQQPNVAGRRFSPEQVRSVAPALEKHTQERLYGAVWNRPGLNKRDRSLVTMAALIARGQAPALGYYADQAIENGVTPREISETIVHLAYYSGWGNAMAAVGPVGEVFAKRGIGRDQLPRRGAAAPAAERGRRSATAPRTSAISSARCCAGPRRSTRPTTCSATCGCAPTSRRATAASSRSRRSSPRAGRAAHRSHPDRAMDNGLTQERDRARPSTISRSTPAGRTRSRRCRSPRRCSTSAPRREAKVIRAVALASGAALLAIGAATLSFSGAAREAAPRSRT